MGNKNKVEGEVKPLTFKDKILEEIKDLSDEEKLSAIDEKLGQNSKHISTHQKELADLQKTYDEEREKQANEIDSLREKLFDKSAGQMLDELQKIAIPAQKKHLIDVIEKVKTNLLAFAMNQKDLLGLKREIQSRIDEKAKDEGVKKLGKMVEQTISKINDAENSFSGLKALIYEVTMLEPNLSARADKLKLAPWMVQLLGLTNFNVNSINAISLEQFAGMVAGFHGSPLDTDLKYIRGHKKHILQGLKGENIYGQAESEATNVELENQISEALSIPHVGPSELTQ